MTDSDSGARVTFILWTGEPGGAENHTAHLCVRLRSRYGLDARVLFLRHGGHLGGFLADNGVPYEELGYASGTHLLTHKQRLLEHLNRFQPDAVVASGYGFESMALCAGGWACRTVVVEHGGGLLSPGMGSARRAIVYRLGRRTTAPRVFAELCVSRFMLSHQQVVPHASNLLVVPNGVDTARYRPRSLPAVSWMGRRDHGIRVGAAGALVPAKGHATLLRAFASLIRGMHDDASKLTIAGDGVCRGQLLALCRELNIEDRVRFLGQLPDLVAFYGDVDVVSVPSSAACRESFGMIAAEAQSCGLPVVASHVGALGEVVADERSGLLVRPDDVEALSGALRRYLMEPDLLKRHGAEARRHALRRLSLDRTAERYAHLIDLVRAGARLGKTAAGARHGGFDGAS
jgi:glycosyltransferase involved in cell wall biosynthesis